MIDLKDDNVSPISFVSRLVRFNSKTRELAIPQIASVLLLFVFGAVMIQSYATKSSIISMLIIASFLGLAAAGQTLVVLLGGIDLSIPFVIGVANVMMAQFNGDRWPIWATFVAILVMAVCVGVVNGLASKLLSIHPLIVTLTTGAILQGALLVWTGGNPTGAAPEWLTKFVSLLSKTGPIPLPPIVAFWIFVVIVLTVLLRKLSSARSIFAVGANGRAADLTLVRSTGVWISVFVMSAIMASLAGIALTGFSSTGYLDIGQPYLFASIATVVIGGTSLLGARGNYWRTALGALMFTEIQTIMIGFGLSQAAQQVVLGVLIVAIMALAGRGEPVGKRI